jgi:hypothetical protein
MAEKPRVQAPKQRADSGSGDSGRARQIVAAVAGLAAALILGGVLFFALGQSGSGGPDVELVRANLDAAGCTLVAKKAPEGDHTVTDPGGTSDKWNTDPPTSGPHYSTAAVFNLYDQEIELARVVHNLEHGGVFILYGKGVPSSTVDRLRAFYDDHKTGTIMAPLDRLGDEFALGAWVAHRDPATGYVAKCTSFDERAVSDFFRAFQFKGPEHFDPSQLRPGQ